MGIKDKLFGGHENAPQQKAPDNIVNPQYYMAPDGTVHSGADMQFTPTAVNTPTFLTNQNQPQPQYPATNPNDTFNMQSPNQPNAYPASGNQQNYGQAPYRNGFNQPASQQGFEQPVQNGYNAPQPVQQNMQSGSGFWEDGGVQNEFTQPAPQQSFEQPVQNEFTQSAQQDMQSGSGFWEDGGN